MTFYPPFADYSFFSKKMTLKEVMQVFLSSLKLLKIVLIFVSIHKRGGYVGIEMLW
jgi:hypothetical protein